MWGVVGESADREPRRRGSSHSSSPALRNHLAPLLVFFNGRSEHSLDSKNRLTIPAKFRDSLGTEVTLTVDDVGCLQLWRRDEFGAHVEGALSSLHPLSSDRADLQRWYMHNSDNVDMDSAGRVAVVAHLARHAGLAKQVLIAGSLGYLELWDPERWETNNTRLGASVGDIRRRLSDAG